MRDFSKAKKIVVKVGTSSLTGKDKRLSRTKVRKLVKDVVGLRKEGKDIIIVSSGAIAAGIGKLGFKERSRDIKMLQATAAVGQNELMRIYREEFDRFGQTIGQILLTREDLSDRKTYLNARNTLLTLLKMGVIPIINENDSVSVEEIISGDNDTLSAIVASNIEADLLIMLSDVDGLYTKDPRRDKRARLRRIVEKIDKDIEKFAGKGTGLGRGGMRTKIHAAKITMKSGTFLVMVNGAEKDIVRRVVAGEDVGTVFIPREKMTDKEHWIMFASKPKGKIGVDEGAANALVRGKATLLPCGVVKDSIKGTFNERSTISIVQSSTGNEIARGITNYTSNEIARVAGIGTGQVEKVLGHKKSKKAVVDKENMVLL